MQHVTLLLDGLSRAAIIPFGPTLVLKLLRLSTNNDNTTDGNSSTSNADRDTTDIDMNINMEAAEQQQLQQTIISWDQIPLPFAMAIAVYIIGRYWGSRQPVRFFSNQHAVGRLAGITFALHLFSLGAGLTSIRYLLLIRFLAGFLSGFLARITSLSSSFSTTTTNTGGGPGIGWGEPDEHFYSKGSCWLEGSTKIYTTGFALSALFGGLIYNSASVNSKFEALTGQEPYTLTPMFFVFCSVIGEFALRFIFWYSSNTPHTREEPHDGDDQGILPMSFKTPPIAIPDDIFNDPLSLSRHSRSRVRIASVDSMTSANRQRADTANSETSLSEFYDCQGFDDFSSFDGEDTEDNDDVCVDKHKDTDVAIYKDAMILYENSNTPAFVPQGDCEAQIPSQYMEVCNNNERKARTMYQATQRWRWQNNVWRIHKRPHPHFEKIKKAYPHFLHGHTREGCAVIYEQPGKMDLKTLFQNGCTVEDMVEHLIFFMEYIGNTLTRKEQIVQLKGEGHRHNSSSWRTTVVMDVTGISVSMLSTDVLKYLSKAGDINNNHYPRTMKRVIIVNAPFWLSGAWSTIKSLAPDSVPVDILSPSKALGGLQKYIDDDQIPELYGGSSPYKLGDHPYENGFRDQVAASNTERGFSSQPIVIRQSSRTMQRQHSEDEETGRLVSKGSRDTSAPPLPPPPPPLQQPLRRRAQSYERRGSMEPIIEVPTPRANDSDGAFEGGILTVVSLLLFFWAAVQGSIECLMPLWIMTPPILGGLGYEPYQAGTSIFCACLVLLWVMRMKVAKTVARTSTRAPMRSFRVGVGTQFVLFILIIAVPNSVVSVARADSVINMTSTVILIATMALSSMSGRSAISILHGLACRYFVEGAKKPNSISLLYGLDRLVTDSKNGKFTQFLQMLGEISGILALAPVYAWSVLKERPSPYDASCCFYASSFMALLLYVASFSLQLNNHDEFVNHPDGSSSRGNCLEVCAVPLNDVMSLLEDAKLSPPLDAPTNGSRLPIYAGGDGGAGPLLKKV